MTRHVFLSVLIVSILLILIGILYTPSIDEDRPILGFPWQIEKLPDGGISVFQIELEKTRLLDIEKQFQEIAEFTLFVPREGQPVVEAYFNEIVIAGLKAKMVVGFEFEEKLLNAMYDNGTRIATLGSGERKVTMHPEDIGKVRLSPVVSLTYMPAINLDAELIEKRFGMPDQKIKDPESDAVHWLYSDKGLDVALSEGSKEVLQYVHPSKFEKILAPLQKAAEEK